MMTSLWRLFPVQAQYNAADWLETRGVLQKTLLQRVSPVFGISDVSLPSPRTVENLIIIPLKTKNNLRYLEIQVVPHSKHTDSGMKTELLMMGR
jgi:hypothetical protein